MKYIIVLIVGWLYLFKIDVVDEFVICKIVKEVNEKINCFQLIYINKDKQDCFLMVFLIYVVDLYKVKIFGGNDFVFFGKFF